MKRMLALAGLLLLLASCGTELTPVRETQDIQELQKPQVRKAGGMMFYASFEGSSTPGTKVFLNDGWKLCWNAGDQISLFNKTADNLQFGFNGAEGDASGSFSPVDPNATLDGTTVPHIYAVFPYDSRTTVASDGTIELSLPAEQVYYGGVSFGCGANTMVSVTENEQERLFFRNVCGYIQLKLYGETAVARVTLKGNSGEKLAGPATVTASTEGAPTVTMHDNATAEVSMVSTEPVVLGKDAEHYTTFMLAIPPTRFPGGFTITVTDADGYVIEKKTTNDYTIGRNVIFPMAPVCCREIETFDIENEGVRNYRTNVDYSQDLSYTLSYVDTYKSTASDDPLPFTVSVSGAGNGKVMVRPLTTPYREEEAAEWHSVSLSSSAASIYNLMPGVVYHYDVLDSQGTSLKSGFVRPDGQIRMIHGVVDNFRDLGGWQADGGTVVYGKLYRGYQLSSLSQNKKDIFLKDLNIAVDLDLRGYNNSGTPSNPLKGSVVYENLQLWKFLGKGSGTTQELYQQAIRDIIGWLGEGKAVYFHCIGGADRTGTLAFLIEALLGVCESDLSKDYELTSFDGVSGHSRKRNDNATTNPDYIFTWLINYLRQDQFGGSAVSINQNVVNWAKTRHSDSVDPLTDAEIASLRKYLVVPINRQVGD